MLSEKERRYPVGFIACGCVGGAGPDNKRCERCCGSGQRTPDAEDVRRLKEQWTSDPCWDIENTDGFEKYRGELQRFAEAWSAMASVRAERDQLRSEGKRLREQARDVERRAERLDDAIVLLKKTHGLVGPRFNVGVGNSA